MARLVLGNTDASGTGRGWIAPTTVQPKFASFFNGRSAGANMAFNGTDAIEVGTAALTGGVVGQSLPCVTLQGGVNFLRTDVAVPREGTFFCVARAVTSPATGADRSRDCALMGAWAASPFTMYLTAGPLPAGCLRTVMPEAQPTGWNTSPPLLADMTRWALYAFRYQRVGTDLVGSARAYTQNNVTSRVAKAGADPVATPIDIGSQPSTSDGTLHGTSQQAAAMIWDVALSDAEMEAVAGLLRRWCARYGVSV